MSIFPRPDKPHAVCLPFPAQGHITPMLKLAILLHHRAFYITFVNTEYNHRRLQKSGAAGSNSPDFHFKTIPDGLPQADSDTTQHIPSLFNSLKENGLAPFRQLLVKLNSSPEAEGIPPVTCTVSDAIMSFAVAAADEIGVPSVCFRTTNACSFLCNKNLRVLMQKGLIPLKDSSYLSNGFLDTTVDCIPGLKNIRLREFPTFIRTTDINDPMLNFILGETERTSKASAIIFNTFDKLEAEVLNALSPLCPPIYAIGPVHLFIDQLPENSLKFIRGNLWKEETECLEWLNPKKRNSVVYVNFGSITVLTPQQLVEFAWGLANSKKNFVWIIRSDIVVGDSANLPSEFVEETKERGLIASWCPQEQVLNHPSIGVFLTHCGWNSTIESMSCGVPMICWPFFADQFINCRFSCTEWGVGLEIDNNVDRVEVEKIVRELIDGEKGKKMKNKAVEWMKKAKGATEINGSSHLNFDKFVEVLLSKKNNNMMA
ncbi:7-deoxyloganetin glucosyltransferase-like [Olea europaea subsp. europaea]|uniref:Glycosyltransferase n=1 Tax=Olea europaea subsp. europaea TaxID=158383 RepID=A0A8S0PWD7_OLEEU|nr:7-deoxyloganetin glucosyltransferase-like [Olea europaea subsp. europaea]